jgi:hemerythrin-like domain-containing protein
MSQLSLRILHSEHRALSAVLRSIELLLGESRRHGRAPEFDALRAMLFYIDEFPEKLHHPKESLLLFPKLRGRNAEVDRVLARLDRDHEQGRRLIQELQHLLLTFEIMGGSADQGPRRTNFEDSVHRYVDFYLAHMKVEESEILPLARASLSAEDWADLDEAFTANRDPLAGCEPDQDHHPMFETLLTVLSSTSVGSAIEALAGVARPTRPHA